MSTIVKAADAAAFLGLVPRMLGFTPIESVVVVPFVGNRSIGAIRFDLPNPSLGEDTQPIASTIAGILCRAETPNGEATDGFAAIAYSDTQDPIALSEFLVRIATATQQCGLREVDLLYISDMGWGQARHHEDIHPLDEIVYAEVPGVRPAAGNQHTGAELPELDEATRQTVADALAELKTAIAAFTGEEPGALLQITSPAMAVLGTLNDLPTLYQEALGWGIEDMTAHEAAGMIWAIARPALRDVALVTWTCGLARGDQAMEAQLRWEQGTEYPADLAMVMWGEGPRPDGERLELALQLCRWLAAAAPADHQAGMLATCGWLAWALGRSSHADAYAKASLALDAEHGLAEIVQSFVTNGHLPDWAFRA